jgi:hypothetical protein
MSNLEKKHGQQEKASELVGQLKIGNPELNVIQQIAHRIYIDDSHGEMDETQFRTYCFVKATLDFMHSRGVELDVKFVERFITETLD